MSAFLRLLLILVIATTISANGDSDEVQGGLNATDGVSEELEALKEKAVDRVVELKKELEEELEDDAVRTINRPTRPPPTIVIQPTPPVPTPSTFDPILIDPTPRPTPPRPIPGGTVAPIPAPFDPILIDPTPRPTPPRPIPGGTVAPTPAPTPSRPVAVPPLATTIPSGLQPICGRRGTCYAWLSDELELFQGGFTRCDALHEHRARRYCCVDANLP